jgi:short-subunit dehydrogenase
MKKTALITGASNGIGLELAKVHAAKGGDLVLVARNKSKLDQLKNELEKEFKVVVHTIGKDLSAVNAAQDIYDETTKQNIQIDYLINNAGFGDFGLFSETSWEKELEMINLNISTLTLFTKLYLKDMLNKGNGKIINVASTASFQPGPMMAVYFATKAYVLSFSEALSNEVSNKGVSVTALCPGPTKSGFQTAASMENSKLFSNKNLPTSKEVAIYGYGAMIKGKTVAIHGFMNSFLSNSIRFVPRAIVLKVSRMILERS